MLTKAGLLGELMSIAITKKGRGQREPGTTDINHRD